VGRLSFDQENSAVSHSAPSVAKPPRFARANAVRTANALFKQVVRAEDLLRRLGYTVIPPAQTPDELRACTITRTTLVIR
jgi:hypothetical protein